MGRQAVASILERHRMHETAQRTHEVLVAWSHALGDTREAAGAAGDTTAVMVAAMAAAAAAIAQGARRRW
jgi:hypothetical protein